MAKLEVINTQGVKTGEIDLSDEVFGISDINQDLFYEVVKAQLASRRAGTHATKGRSAVAGSKKKLYKQKGTGNARHGNIRAPIFCKGGKVHTPQPRDYGYRPPRKVRAGALSTRPATTSSGCRRATWPTPPSSRRRASTCTTSSVTTP